MLKKDVYEYTTGTPSVKKNAQCADYTYENNWKDQLTKFKYTNGSDQTISYDVAGNPLNYRGSTLTWKDGRKLSTYARNGVTASYTYDQNGDRIKKMVGNNTRKILKLRNNK